ncbi:MAG TPA: isoprenylcysteine carboxylmethyltransferase family protein [Chthoniobacteraceae bacterium]|jgi:protein-S-isoprenylcysteine O-methyltransferase Ste14|nr:isoprenylcysteine carboxylmethyltransferase family protein [Chthoniobacteraceae bacterium]
MPLAASLRTRITQVTDFAEAYLLSAMYLCQAAQVVRDVFQNLSDRPVDALDRGLWVVGTIRDVNYFLVFLLIAIFLLFRHPAGNHRSHLNQVLVPFTVTIFFIVHLLGVFSDGELLWLYLTVGVLLFIRHPAAEGPRDLKEVFVPLAVTLFFLAYRLPSATWAGRPWLPAPLRESLGSPELQFRCAIASLFFGAAGSLIAVWGVVSLGRSFGIFVAVRKIVLIGPYRYVRHPIYSGYVLIWLGIVLANLSIAVMALVAIHTLLMIYRARLEERRLAEASPEYRAHMEVTGFLFPRLRAGSTGAV